MKTPRQSSRQRERTDLTRARLIRSAEKVFARDGFEAAKLEEIAADAGYTRGAFYANFENKEDLFFALLEEGIATRIETVQREMDKVAEPEAKLQKLREFFVQKTFARRWNLLSLEFKLFAIRHPQVKARLATMNRRFVSARVQILQETMKGLGRDLPVSANAAGLALSALTNALTLEHILDPTAMAPRDVKRIVAGLFDNLTAAIDHSTARGHRKQHRQLPN